MKKHIIGLFNIFLIGILLISNQIWSQCNTPVNTSVSNITATSAHFSWNLSASEPGFGYQIEVRTSGTPGSGATGLAYSGSVIDGISSVLVENLSISTEYTFYIRYKCDEDTLFSSWSSGLIFSTLNIQPPLATAALYVSDETFTAKWNLSPGAVFYLLDVSEDSDFSSFITENQQVNISSFVVMNLMPLTTYYYRLRSVAAGNVESDYSNVIEVTTLEESEGYVVWTEAGWSADPLLELDAIIEFDFDTSLHNGFEANSLFVKSGYTLVIADATSIYVWGEVVVEDDTANIVVQNNASLVQLDDYAPDNVGSITVERNSSPVFRLDYTMWSSPTSSPLNVENQTLREFSPGTVLNRYYSYNTLLNTFDVITDPVNTAFEPGVGYLIRIRNNHVPYEDENSVPQVWTGVFRGIPNNGEIYVPVSDVGQGFNMIGNPYPSVISAEEFIYSNYGEIDGTLYFWRRKNVIGGGGDLGTFYASYTLGGSTTTSPTSEAPNGFIQVGQGFVVKAEPSTSTVLFNNSQRVGDEFDNQFFRTGLQEEKNRFWLNLTNADGVFSQMMVGYMDIATDEFDKGIDGEFINDSEVALTSLINNERYTIQGKGLPFSNEDIVPLHISISEAGDYTINFSHADGFFAADQNIYLYDYYTNEIHDIKSEPYTFFTEVGAFDNRFSIVYQNQPLGVNGVVDANSVIAYKQDGYLNIHVHNQVIEEVKLFDLQGRILFCQNIIHSDNFAINSLMFSNQPAVIRIALEDGSVVVKKIIL